MSAKEKEWAEREGKAGERMNTETPNFLKRVSTQFN